MRSHARCGAILRRSLARRALLDPSRRSGSLRSPGAHPQHALAGSGAGRCVGPRHRPRVPEAAARILGRRLRLAFPGASAERVRSVPRRTRRSPHPLRPRAGAARSRNPADPEPRLAERLRRAASARAAPDRSRGRAGLRRRHSLAARLRLLRAARPTRDVSVHRRSLAQPHARAGVRALRSGRRRFRGRSRDVDGAGRPGAHDRRPPEQPRARALHRAGVAASVRRRA
jgi:hypothetical protein